MGMEPDRNNPNNNSGNNPAPADPQKNKRLLTCLLAALAAVLLFTGI